MILLLHLSKGRSNRVLSSRTTIICVLTGTSTAHIDHDIYCTDKLQYIQIRIHIVMLW